MPLWILGYLHYYSNSYGYVHKSRNLLQCKEATPKILPRNPNWFGPSPCEHVFEMLKQVDFKLGVIAYKKIQAEKKHIHINSNARITKAYNKEKKKHETRNDSEIFNSEDCKFDPGAVDYFRHTHTRTCVLFVQVEQMQVHTPGLLSNRCWCSARAAWPCAWIMKPRAIMAFTQINRGMLDANCNSVSGSFPSTHLGMQ